MDTDRNDLPLTHDKDKKPSIWHFQKLTFY